MRSGRIAALHAALLFGATGATIPALAQASATAPAVFAPPEGEPMLLTRTLRRELSDGKAIVATRRYRVSFVRSLDGWTVQGALVASDIDAPPSLAVLAAIERQRPDDSLFPIRLDNAGIIRPRDGAGSPDDSSWRAAFDVANKLIAAPSAPLMDSATRGMLARQMQTVAGSAALSHWPVKLFLPTVDASREERRFTLADGGEGLIVTELDRLPADGLETMGQAERTVVTEVAGSRRVTREQWSLQRISS